MRIAYVLLDPGIGVFGTKGASVHVQEVVRAFRSDRHDVTVFCTRVNDDVPADLADLDVRRHRLPKGTGAEREQAVAAAAADIAAEISAGGFDLVYERYSLFSDAIVRLPGIPSILEVNAPLISEQREHRSLHDEAAASTTTRCQLASASVVSCVSEAVARWTIEQGADPRSVVVTPNGVNTDRITPAPARAAAGGATGNPASDGATGNPASDGATGNPSSAVASTAPVTVGFVGTLKPWHGTDLLLQALARTAVPLRLDICGTGPQQDALERMAHDLGIADRVLLRGAVAPALVPTVLHGFDIAVAPYPVGEHYFSPLKVYEYLAAGLPIVASAIGTIPTVLRGGELGVLVEPGNIDELAAALDELAADPGRRRHLGEQARAAAVAEHDWRSRCRKLLENVGVLV